MLLGATDGRGQEIARLPGEEAGGSISLGDTSDGRLVDGARLEESDAVGILPEQRAHGLHYGTDELIAMLEHAAGELQRSLGRRMWVGHLSRREGGDIAYSVSHNSGRDADIAFCYRDRFDKAVDPPDLVGLLPNGVSPDAKLKLDVPCTWAIVKALLSFSGADVQHLFIARSFKQRLLEHAAKTGESRRLRARAEEALRQPGGGSAVHDDHLHLRIYCSREDALAGCVDSGRVQPWAKSYRAAKLAKVKQVVGLLDDAHPDVRAAATQRLGLLGAKAYGQAIVRRLADDHREVRVAAAAALLRFGEPRHRRVIHRWLDRQPVERRAATIQALGHAREAATGPMLARLLRLEDDHRVRIAAIDAALQSEALYTVPALVHLLGDRDPAIRNHALEALRRLTNRSFGGAPDQLPRKVLVGRIDHWHGVWRKHRDEPRDDWLARGYRMAGYGVWELKRKHAWELVRAVAGDDHHAYNAHRLLTRLFGEEPAAWSDDPKERRELCKRWLDWLDARRETFRLRPPTPAARRACGVY